MSIRRPRSSPDSIPEHNRNSPPSSSEFDEQMERSPAQPRQTSIRISRRVDDAGQSRLAATSRSDSNDARRSTSSNSHRVRRPTPIVRRRNEPSPMSDEDQRESSNRHHHVTYAADTESNHHTDRDPSAGASSNSRRRLDVRHTSGNRSMRGSLITRNHAGHHHGSIALGHHYSQVNGLPLTWYERLLPEFLLNMTAPITGYEAHLDSDDVDDVEYEILERQRLKRNKKVRRRLLSVILIAGAAGLFLYTRGKMFRKMGVKATASSLKHRLEDGLARSIQETMGK